MTYDMNYFSERLRCTPEEKRECLETVRLITGAFEIVRYNGLLALKKVVKRVDDPFFRDFAPYIIENYDPESVRRACDRMLIAGDYRGKELLHNLLIVEGMLVIQSAEREGLVNELSPWFGAGWREAVSNTVCGEQERLYSKKPRQTSVCPEFDRLLELPPQRRDALAKEIWACTRSKNKDLFRALAHAGDPVKRYLLEGLKPVEREDVLCGLEDIFIRWTEESESEEIQRKVLAQLSADGSDSLV